MSICELENKLFAEWQGKRKGFVKDGVVSEDDYLSSKPKIALILKEVNSKDDGWNLIDFVREGARPQTWNNVARWVHGIRNRESMQNWSYYSDSKMTNEFRTDMLKSICIINLKKSPGTHTTDNATLDKVAKEDKEFIQRQFKIYEPDLTICGGTGGLFKEVLGFGSLELKQTKRGIQYFNPEQNKYVVCFAHPEARIQDSLLHYGLLDAINEIYTDPLSDLL
jgi:hypothetical protein